MLTDNKDNVEYLNIMWNVECGIWNYFKDRKALKDTKDLKALKNLKVPKDLTHSLRSL